MRTLDLDQLILNILQNNIIQEQVELQNQLQSSGYNLPQATLSRRLKKLNIAKVAGQYKVFTPHQSVPIIRTMQISDFGLIVLHTHPGQANSLAFFLDQKYVSSQTIQKNPMLLGTIAGDDTVLLITKNTESSKALIQSLYNDFPYLRLEHE